MNITGPPIVLILCMHRSGSSLAAQLISKSGFYMGESLRGGNHYNPDGYFEFLPLVAFHENMLAYLGMTWYLPFKEVPVDNLLETFGEEAKELLTTMDRPGVPWCWKDPRLAIFLPFWQRLLQGRQVVSIITSRNPAAIASSLLHRSQLPEFHSLALWEYSMLQILQFLQNMPGPAHIISYEQLTERPESTYVALADFLRSTVNEEAPTWDSVDIAKIIKPSLNRQNVVDPSALSENQARLLTLLSDQNISIHYIPFDRQLNWLRSYFSLFKNDPNQVRNEIESRLFWKEKESDTFSATQYLSSRIVENKISFSSSEKLNIRFLRLHPANVVCAVKISQVCIDGQGNAPIAFHVSDSNALHVENEIAYFSGTHNWITIDLGLHYKDVTTLEIIFAELKTGMEVAKILLSKNDKKRKKTEQNYEQLLCRTGEIKWLLRRLRHRLKQKLTHRYNGSKSD